MRKINPFPIVLLLLLLSAACKKEYLCNCEVHGTGLRNGVDWPGTGIEAGTKSKAQKECNKFRNFWADMEGITSAECTLVARP